MNTINFLPWRKARVALERKMGFAFGIVLLICALFSFFMRYLPLLEGIKTLEIAIAKQKAMTRGLLMKEKEANQLRTLEAGLIEKINFIEGIEKEKRAIPLILTKLLKSKPATIRLKKIKASSSFLYLKGEVLGSRQLHDYIKQLNQESFVQKSTLIYLNINPKDHSRHFLLRLLIDKQDRMLQS